GAGVRRPVHARDAAGSGDLGDRRGPAGTGVAPRRSGTGQGTQRTRQDDGTGHHRLREGTGDPGVAGTGEARRGDDTRGHRPLPTGRLALLPAAGTRGLVATTGGTWADVHRIRPRARIRVSWRRDGDLNPGDGYPPTRSPGVPLRPLGHPSGADSTG